MCAVWVKMPHFRTVRSFFQVIPYHQFCLLPISPFSAKRHKLGVKMIHFRKVGASAKKWQKLPLFSKHTYLPVCKISKPSLEGTRREKCPNTQFFLVRLFPHSDQKKLRIWTLHVVGSWENLFMDGQTNKQKDRQTDR